MNFKTNFIKTSNYSHQVLNHSGWLDAPFRLNTWVHLQPKAHDTPSQKRLRFWTALKYWGGGGVKWAGNNDLSYFWKMINAESCNIVARILIFNIICSQTCIMIDLA